MIRDDPDDLGEDDPDEDPAATWEPIESLVPWSGNPRVPDSQPVQQVATSIERFGFGAPVLVRTSDRVLIAGHTRLRALEWLRTQVPRWPTERVAALGARLGCGSGVESVMARLSYAPVRFLDLTEAEAHALALADNRLGELAEWDDSMLADALRDLQAEEFPVSDLGWDDDAVRALLDPADSNADPNPARPSLADRFVVPPMSVLDARQGYWQDRKRRWLSMGIESESGRGERLTFVSGSRPVDQLDPVSAAILDVAGGPSVFDPVLCEIAYRWFCPPGGSVLDPFAGGSVRGIVAGILGHPYTGIDIRAEQVAANVQQADSLCGHIDTPDHMPDVTGVELHGELWFKRDDLFTVAGVRGGKARTCWSLAQGASGLVTAGSKSSPQVNIVAQIARRIGVPCRVHTPCGDPGSEVAAAVEAGAERIEHAPGYNNVLIARARDDARARGWTEIPFGMECDAAVTATRAQVVNIPADVRRLVVPVGSGMSLAGILWGLTDCERPDLPVVGVVVGADPTKRLDRYAPPGWRKRVTLVPAGMDYHAESTQTRISGVPIELDPVYEAKAIPILRPGDCLWVVGARQPRSASQMTVRPTWIVGDSMEIPRHVGSSKYDLVFSCPPYGNLERYSDDPRDISAMDADGFAANYRQIIAHAVDRLHPDRFAVWVVGEYRTRAGFYAGLVPDTIRAFEAAGARLYNEAVLVTPFGSVPLMVGQQFRGSRKLGKTHQNVLVFYKGDNPSRDVRTRYGDIDVELPVD